MLLCVGNPWQEPEVALEAVATLAVERGNLAVAMHLVEHITRLPDTGGGAVTRLVKGVAKLLVTHLQQVRGSCTCSTAVLTGVQHRHLWKYFHIHFYFQCD